MTTEDQNELNREAESTALDDLRCARDAVIEAADDFMSGQATLLTLRRALIDWQSRGGMTTDDIADKREAVS